jgi:hypothetical protein
MNTPPKDVATVTEHGVDNLTGECLPTCCNILVAGSTTNENQHRPSNIFHRADWPKVNSPGSHIGGASDRLPSQVFRGSP